MDDQTRRPDINAVISYLVEECGDVLKAANETARWGLFATTPGSSTARETNLTWMLRELRDLEAAIATTRETLNERARDGVVDMPKLSLCLIRGVSGISRAVVYKRDGRVRGRRFRNRAFDRYEVAIDPDDIIETVRDLNETAWLIDAYRRQLARERPTK